MIDSTYHTILKGYESNFYGAKMTDQCWELVLFYMSYTLRPILNTKSFCQKGTFLA